MPLRSLLLLVFWVGLYYSPFVAGMLRRRSDPTRGPNPVLLFLIVTFLGWTLIGWLAAWYLVFPEAGSASPVRINYPEETRREPRICSECQGTGRMTCPVCKGMGQQTQCVYCGTTGRVQCTAAHSY